MAYDAAPDATRAERIRRLTPLQRETLFQVVGEAAVDLWLHRAQWEDLVERCLEAVEEDDEALLVPVPVRDASHAGGLA